MFATPEEAEHAFYEALEQADSVRLMQIWADDEEVVCIHPGGLRIVGHSAVQESWQQVQSHLWPRLFSMTRCRESRFGSLAPPGIRLA